MIIYDPAEIDFDRPGKHTYEVAFHLDGSWGYAMLPMTVINGGPGKSVACFGGTHGNEYEGQVAVRRLAHELSEVRGRVILIPRLNAPACQAGRRESPLDGVNMNRAFPGNARGTVTYRIADFVTRYIFPKVDVVLDLHAAGRGLEMALLTSMHAIDDPRQRSEMERVAALFDTPFIFVYSSKMASGLLTEEAERAGKVTIGGEFGHSEGVSLRGIRHAYEGARNVLKHYRVLPGEVTRIDPSITPRVVKAIGLSEYIPAPFSGIYEPATALGSSVEEGQILGRLYDFERVEAPPTEVRAPHAGWLMAQTFNAPVVKGDTMIVVANEV